MSQGKLIIRSVSVSGTISGLVVPRENPSDWYFQPFPTREVMEHYAREYDLEIEEQNGDSGEER